MSVKPEQRQADTFTNPVYPHSFPDPFVLKYGGRYFAYATGHAANGDVFDVLTSTDLVNWTHVGAAMKPLDDPAPFYWAPEVTFAEGKFYLYYSVGNETLMHIRVAIADRPEGPFEDAGRRLTSEDFAIDAHVFVDEDGQSYLFYATDFLEHSHIGTGTVVDKMVDWLTLEGNPRPVTRAKYDWQVYDPARKEKGSVRWHTVEGPSVIKHKGRYYEMYSGGNWQNTSYGVSFAVTDDIEGKDEWEQYSDGETVLPLLRTVPGKVVGPGHNSIVRGPNGRELYCVYHRWTDAGRVMAIDRMDFAGERMFLIGATDTPQPIPYEPISSDFDQGWLSNGEWTFSNNNASGRSGPLSLSRPVPQCFLAEFIADVPSAKPHVGIRLSGEGQQIEVLLNDHLGQTQAGTYHVCVEADGRWVRVKVDGWFTAAKAWLDEPINELALFADDGPVGFSEFRLTTGYEDLFDRGDDGIARGDWRLDGGAGRISEEQLVIQPLPFSSCTLSRAIGYRDLDLAVNVRCLDPSAKFVLDLRSDERAAISLACGSRVEVTANGVAEPFSLPQGWDITEVHQYRFYVRHGRALVYLEDVLLGEFKVEATPLQPAIRVEGAGIALDMIRLTAI